jgi:drug/metabolite transporter (DMT)-like permease
LVNKAIKLRENKILLAWIILVLLALFWGMSFIMIKRVVHAFTPIEIGAARIFIAGLTLSPWAFSSISTFPKKKGFLLVLSGLMGYLLPAFIFATVGSKINSSLAGTLNSTTPIFVLIIGAMFFARKILKFQVIGLILGFFGSLLLIFTGSNGNLDFNNPYALLGIGATVMYGINGNLIGNYLMDVKPMQLSAYSLFSVGLIAFVILLFTDFFSKILMPQNAHLLIYLLILGALNSGFAAVLFNFLIQISSPIFASSVTYLIPVVAVIAGILDGEVISFWHFMGMGVILTGVYLINKK